MELLCDGTDQTGKQAHGVDVVEEVEEEEEEEEEEEGQVLR
jgi:hypothetical protein